MTINVPERSISHLRHPERKRSINIRHAERSEARNFFSPMRLRPSAVEGPGAASPSLHAAPRIRYPQSPTAAAVHGSVPSYVRISFTPPGSFDSGSAQVPGEKHLPLASAQDDGGFGARASSLVPELHLGTRFPARSFGGGATKLRGQVRSQMEFGNEGSVPSHVRVSFTQAGSFDSSSTQVPGEKHLPLAFAQDDGGFGARASSLVPELHLGTRFPARSFGGGATKLRGQVRSQMEFGNEGSSGGFLFFSAQGLQKLCHPCGDENPFWFIFRWCRPRRARPPARVRASLRLALTTLAEISVRVKPTTGGQI